MSNNNRFSCWLVGAITVSNNKQYWHQCLYEQCDRQAEILEELRIYVQRAHEDAKNCLRKQAGYSLDPLNFSSSEDPVKRKQYPEALHIDDLKGYFGEIIAGFIAEYFSPFGIDKWKVPAFLFKFHLPAFQRLEQVSQTHAEAKRVPGRTGDDCLAFQLDRNGNIVRLLYCEAKCTAEHDTNLISDAHTKVSDAEVVDLLQLVDILQNRGGLDSQKWIQALRQLDEKGATECERYDLVSYACGRSPKRKETWLSISQPHKNYTASRKLEAVEIHLCDVERLVREVYDKKEIASITPTISLAREKMDIQPDSKLIEYAQGIREQLAGTRFPPSLAKLYSQHALLDADQRGLSSWQSADTADWLNNAVRLIDAGFIERDAKDDNWRDSIRRAGEILEWLSPADLNPDKLPLRLLSASAYQLAAYPARARGLLNETVPTDDESAILHLLLKAEFSNLFKHLLQYWSRDISGAEIAGEITVSKDEGDIFFEELQRKIITEIVRSLGILCAEMRWGGESRLKVALDQLINVGKVFLHTAAPYSWLLAKLCTETASVYAKSSMRGYLTEVASGLNSEGKRTLEHYLRHCYQDNKSLAWPSQICGVEQLTKGGSFALCTPTGSGKTTVAQMAIMQSLFLELPESETEVISSVPLALYLVPSKALSAEIESGLAKAFRHMKISPIIVTNLYGGADWGPTDSWFLSNQPTVLICTYEKAEALIRFLGPLFLKRISLIVIDEAHFIQFDGNNATLCKAENRSLRLEVMGTRLLTYLNQYQRRGKVIALSAVATSMKETLACWITGQKGSVPVETSYRSTRQLVGRLECLPDRGFVIHNDLLDGARLELEGDRKSIAPYIPHPFPACPPLPEWEDKSKNQGPEKHLRPYLLWAAMQLALPDAQGNQKAVLVSVTQDISSYARDFLDILKLIEEKAANPPLFESSIEFPLFFQPPTEPEKWNLWDKCLRSCEDYFGTESVEYKLLRKGIVIHHGKMPGLLARFLVELIDERVIHLVLATSTLSEGVNLPFETILIPSLRRRKDRISVREFGNLIGRAGRPGFGTEGRSLVLLDSRSARDTHSPYNELIKDLSKSDSGNREILSPLAALLVLLQKQWSRISNTNDSQAFLDWLDQTSPLSKGDNMPESPEAIQTLDALDSILLSIVAEMEQLANEDLAADELEKYLIQIWQRSYAYYSTQQEQRLGEIFVRRGIALKKNIYPQSLLRRRLYRTGMPPRSGNQLLSLLPDLKEYFKLGAEYARWPSEDRFGFIREIIDRLKTIPSLVINETMGERGNKATWDDILQWWLVPHLTGKKPPDSSSWYDYVSKNFIYRLNWGIGSVVALAIDDVNNGNVIEPSFENWPLTDLPWIVLWLKELIIWGTLEPVAAYLLARGIAVTRAEAEEKAKLYYAEQSPDILSDELLNTATIREWAKRLSGRENQSYPVPPRMKVYLMRDFSGFSDKQWRVIPVEADDEIYWFDPGGFHLATCQKPENWQSSYIDAYDFILVPHKKEVSSSPYI